MGETKAGEVGMEATKEEEAKIMEGWATSSLEEDRAARVGTGMVIAAKANAWEVTVAAEETVTTEQETK